MTKAGDLLHMVRSFDGNMNLSEPEEQLLNAVLERHTTTTGPEREVALEAAYNELKAIFENALEEGQSTVPDAVMLEMAASLRQRGSATALSNGTVRPSEEDAEIAQRNQACLTVMRKAISAARPEKLADLLFKRLDELSAESAGQAGHLVGAALRGLQDHPELLDDLITRLAERPNLANLAVDTRWRGDLHRGFDRSVHSVVHAYDPRIFTMTVQDLVQAHTQRKEILALMRADVPGLELSHVPTMEQLTEYFRRYAEIPDTTNRHLVRRLEWVLSSFYTHSGGGVDYVRRYAPTPGWVGAFHDELAVDAAGRRVLDCDGFVHVASGWLSGITGSDGRPIFDLFYAFQSSEDLARHHAMLFAMRPGLVVKINNSQVRPYLTDDGAGHTELLEILSTTSWQDGLQGYKITDEHELASAESHQEPLYQWVANQPFDPTGGQHHPGDRREPTRFTLRRGSITDDGRGNTRTVADEALLYTDDGYAEATSLDLVKRTEAEVEHQGVRIEFTFESFRFEEYQPTWMRILDSPVVHQAPASRMP